MKQHWETEDLIDSWTLLPAELETLANKTAATQLGFAVLPKFFALETRFPHSAAEFPLPTIEYVAKQVRVAPELFSEYRLRGRSVSYHRTEIRELFDFREATHRGCRTAEPMAAERGFTRRGTGSQSVVAKDPAAMPRMEN